MESERGIDAGLYGVVGVDAQKIAAAQSKGQPAPELGTGGPSGPGRDLKWIS